MSQETEWRKATPTEEATGSALFNCPDFHRKHDHSICQGCVEKTIEKAIAEERLACIADACHLCRDNVPVEYHARISTWRHSTQFGQVPCAAGRIRERMEKEGR